MITTRVEKILRESKRTRSDDYLLYARYIMKHYPNLKHVELVDAFRHHKNYRLPSFKSISRVRQKLQELHPELKGE